VEKIIESFVQLGALGVICAALFYLVVTMQKRLFTIVENNTKVMTEVKTVIDKCNK
jgi:hypothetical protein